MEKYQQIKRRQQDEFDLLPIFWAYSNKQLEEGMQSFNLTMDDVGLINSIGSGGYCLKTDIHLFHELMARHDKEFKACIDADKTGEGFIFHMFDYELSNHEYCITHDEEPTMDALGLTLDDIKKSTVLQHGLKLAIRENWRES